MQWDRMSPRRLNAKEIPQAQSGRSLIRQERGRVVEADMPKLRMRGDLEGWAIYGKSNRLGHVNSSRFLVAEQEMEFVMVELALQAIQCKRLRRAHPGNHDFWVDLQRLLFDTCNPMAEFRDIVKLALTPRAWLGAAAARGRRLWPYPDHAILIRRECDVLGRAGAALTVTRSETIKAIIDTRTRALGGRETPKPRCVGVYAGRPATARRWRSSCPASSIVIRPSSSMMCFITRPSPRRPRFAVTRFDADAITYGAAVSGARLDRLRQHLAETRPA